MNTISPITWKKILNWAIVHLCITIFQLYHVKNKLIFQWDDEEVRFVLDQQD